jgi:hypothetical protein
MSLGSAFVAIMTAGALYRAMDGRTVNERFDGSIAALRTFNALGAHLLRGIGNSAVMVTLLLGMLLLGFRLLLRSSRLAAGAVFLVVMFLHLMNFGDSIGGIVMALAATIMVTTLIMRGGLLPMVAFLGFTNVVANVPLTWDPSSWAFPYTLAAIAVTLVPAAWAMRTAMGGGNLMARDALLD